MTRFQAYLSPLAAGLRSGSTGWLRLSSWWLMLLAALSLSAAGYLATYQVFFAELPLEDITYRHKGGQPEEFMYNGVVWFEGTRLAPDSYKRMIYQSNRLLDACRHKKLELFLRLADLKNDASATRVGKLVVTQQSGAGKSRKDTFVLERTLLQRHVVPLLTHRKEVNRIEIRYSPDDPERSGDLLVGTNVRDVRTWPLALVLTVFAGGLFYLAARMRGGLNLGLVASLVLPLGLLSCTHGGAVVSNEIFPAGQLRIGGMTRHYQTILETGYFPPKQYRNFGFTFIPMLVHLVEGDVGLERPFHEFYPTSKYLTFLWTAVSLAVLLAALYRWIHPHVALLTGFLYALYYPFIYVLYYADADAYFVPQMTLMTALFVHYAFGGRSWKYLLGMAAVLAWMLSVKITPVFLALTIPASLWLGTVVTRRTWRDRQAATALAVLLLAVLVGGRLRSAYQHPNRHIGIDGIPFQKHVFWHMAWGAAGTYDSDNAHSFTRSGRLRNQRVAAITGLPDEVTYIRQSQRATEEVYKPGVLNALRERPGFFYSVAFRRASDTLFTFQKYPEFNPQMPIYEEKGMERLTRFGKMWKAAPLMLLGKTTQLDVPRILEFLLLASAAFGLFLLPRTEFVTFAWLAVAARIVFMVLVHSLTRYMIFTHVMFLIGLAALLATGWYVLSRASASMFNGAQG